MFKRVAGWFGGFWAAGFLVLSTTFVITRLIPAVYRPIKPYGILLIFWVPLAAAALWLVYRWIRPRKPPSTGSARTDGPDQPPAQAEPATSLADVAQQDAPVRLKVFGHTLPEPVTSILATVAFGATWWLIDRFVHHYIPGPIGTALAYVSALTMSVVLPLSLLGFACWLRRR